MKPPSALRRVLILALVVISTVMLGLIVVMKTTSRPKRAATSATTTAPAQSAAPATEQVPPVRGDELAARLDLRKAFDAWEVEVQKSADPAIRRRIANGAFELGRAYLAAGDDANAAFYLEKVVRYGEPESEPVRVAQRRLQYLKRPGSL